MSSDRFRFRSPERDRESDERRFGLVRMTVRSAIGEAETEAKGLRARIAEARRSAMFVVGHDVGPARDALRTRDQQLRTIEQRLAQLEDHLTALRKLERRLNRLIDQPRVFGLSPF
jgi:DNA repair exonuclease SbcCD ATPase subunit